MLLHKEIQILSLYFSLLYDFSIHELKQKNILGKYVPAISYRIHQMNKKEDRPMKMPLKGLAIGDGLCDPSNQLDYGDFLYQVGLLGMVLNTIM